MIMEALPVSPGLQEMGLKHPEKVFDGRFNQLAQAVVDLDVRMLPLETNFPMDYVATYERRGLNTKQAEKAVKGEVKLVCNQFNKGPEGFGKLTAEEGSTFMALGAMIFPENPDLAYELATKMTKISMNKPINPNFGVCCQEEELIFQKMPVVAVGNCLLAASLRQMAEEKYKAWGNTIVNTVAQLINWEGKEKGPQDGLTEIEKDCLNYGLLYQQLRGAASGIDISLNADKNWRLLSKEMPNSKFVCPPGIDKDSFKFEGHQLIAQGVSPEDFIKIARALRPAAEEEPFHLISEEELRQNGERGEKLQPVSDLLPEAEQEETKEEGDDEPDWLKSIRREQKAVQAEPEKRIEPEAEPKESGEIKIAMKTSWASEAVAVTKDANGGVRIDPKNPELPSKWKKDGRQHERRGEVVVIKAGDKEVELLMVDKGKSVTGFPKEVENQMSYFFELDFGYSVRAEEVRSWFKDLPVLDYLRGSDPLKWGEAKIERREPGDSLTLTIGQTKYHICVPNNSSNVKVSWFDTRRSDYNEHEFPAKELLNDLSAMAEIYTNVWLGKEVPHVIDLTEFVEQSIFFRQNIAKELIKARETLPGTKYTGEILTEDEVETIDKLEARIKELENIFEGVFGVARDDSLFKRAFDVVDANFVGNDDKDKTELFDLRDELVKLGIDSCAEGKVKDENRLNSIYSIALGILGKHKKNPRLTSTRFISDFKDLLGIKPESGAVPPFTEELPDWLAEEPKEKKAKSKPPTQIALTDFRL